MSRPKRKGTRPAGNYLAALDVLASQVKAGDVVNVTVRHDRHCNLLAGRGPCSCEPEIEAEGVTIPSEAVP